jgi:hypothetical protein
MKSHICKAIIWCLSILSLTDWVLSSPPSPSPINFRSLNLGSILGEQPSATRNSPNSGQPVGTKLKQIKNYYLKWITNEYLFPVWIEKNLTLDADYKWFKYSEGLFIDEIDDHQASKLTNPNKLAFTRVYS